MYTFINIFHEIIFLSRSVKKVFFSVIQFNYLFIKLFCLYLIIYYFIRINKKSKIFLFYKDDNI